jgi:predicted RNase H-like HicB family nuclease
VSEQVEYTIRVHHEDGQVWGEVVDLPGCFASGDSLDEVVAGLTEALSMVLRSELTVSEVGPATDAVEEHRLLVTSSPQQETVR